MTINWIKVVLIAHFVLISLITVGSIGKQRKPATPGIAVAVLCVQAAVIAGVVFA